MRKAGLLTTLKSKLKKVRSNFMWRWDDYLILILSAVANVAICFYVYEFVSNYFIIYGR